jgi:hypothetical protein
MIIASVDMYSGFISPLFLGPILCDIKKIDVFSPSFGRENDPNQIWKNKFLILHENKFIHNFKKLNENNNSKLQQQLVFTLFASSPHNVILIVMLI